MSVDFTFALAGPPLPLFELMVGIESRMEEMGFRKSGNVYKVELDERGVFEENEEYVISMKKFEDSKTELENWNGLSVEFNCSDFTVYVLIANYENQYINSFIEVSGKVIDKLLSDDKMGRFFQLILAIAVSIQSFGGFGTYELPFEPVAPDKAIPYIFRNTEGVPSLLGIIPYNMTDESKLRKTAEKEFSITVSTMGFYFLEHKDFRS